MLSPTNLLEFDFKWPTVVPGEVLALTLLMAFAILSTLEFQAPRDKLPAKFLRRSYKTNISLFVVNSIAMSLVSASSLLILAERYSDKGLLSSLSSSGWKAVLSFLSLDLLMYLWHIASHKVDCLWMFHKVHHNDPYLNTSTAFRIHFLELFITHILKAVLVVILGIEEAMLMISELIMTLFIMFHHTNITFKGEKLLSHIIIVPYLHRTHHSTERHEHDSNYGAVLSLWDRLFGTLVEQNPIEIGIKENSPQDLVNLIKFGFTLPAPLSAQPVNLDNMIAEAAYYKAEKRSFYPGNEMHDWLEAKREITNSVYQNQSIKSNRARKLQYNYLKFMNLDINFRRIQNF
ncbi:sterol desaturase family protein [Methylobacter psychrophilus]|uniref:sterol desaturase family protein n=1 Tax=Methylobacter psychrophilus TaxID=96941 RepID=UPI0021D4B839|nr:sterol desaturase family protein [Methylobacter psychrophilus]